MKVFGAKCKTLNYKMKNEIQGKKLAGVKRESKGGTEKKGETGKLIKQIEDRKDPKLLGIFFGIRIGDTLEQGIIIHI